MSQEPPNDPPEPPRVSPKKLALVFLPILVVTHTMAAVVLYQHGIELNPLAIALMIGSTLTVGAFFVVWAYMPRE